MLRSLALALLGLSLLAGPVAARGDGGVVRRADATAAVGGAKAERSSLLRRVSATAPRFAASGPVCARGRRGAAARCRGGAVQPVSWSWAQGLPPALGVQAQQECPAGTMATLAEGHDDVVRCIPI